MGEPLRVSGHESQGGDTLDALDGTIIAAHVYLTDSLPMLLDSWRALLAATHTLGSPTRYWSVPSGVDGCPDIGYGWKEERLGQSVTVGVQEPLGTAKLLYWGRARGYAVSQAGSTYSLGRLAAGAEANGDFTKYDELRRGLDSATRSLAIGVTWNSAVGRPYRPLLQADMPTIPDFVSFWKAARDTPDPNKALSLYDDTRARVKAQHQKLATMAFILDGNDQGPIEM